MMLERLKAIVL